MQLSTLVVFVLRADIRLITNSVGTATELETGLSGDRIPLGARFFAPVQTGRWGPPSLLYNGYRSFARGGRGESGQGVELTIHPHLASGLKKEYSYTSTPPMGLSSLF